MDRQSKRRRLNPKDASESEDERLERYFRLLLNGINRSASELSTEESEENEGASSEEEANEEAADSLEGDSDEESDSEEDDVIQEGCSRRIL